MPTIDTVTWSKESYSPAEILAKFKDKLPLVAVVTNGYYGQNEMETFAQDQMMHFNSWGKQKRVLAKDSWGRILSIPAQYPILFEVKTKKVYTKPMSIEEILLIYSLPLIIRFDQSMATNFYIGCNTKNTELFGDIELHSTYEEMYLKGNTINQGVITLDTMIVVPSYLNIYLAVGEGLKGGETHEWQRMLENYAKLVANLDFDALNGNMDIMLFMDDTNHSEYASLVPDNYVRHEYVTNLFRSKNSYRVESIYNSNVEPLYDEVPVEEPDDNKVEKKEVDASKPALPPRKGTLKNKGKKEACQKESTLPKQLPTPHSPRTNTPQLTPLQGKSKGNQDSTTDTQADTPPVAGKSKDGLDSANNTRCNLKDKPDSADDTRRYEAIVVKSPQASPDSKVDSVVDTVEYEEIRATCIVPSATGSRTNDSPTRSISGLGHVLSSCSPSKSSTSSSTASSTQQSGFTSIKDVPVDLSDLTVEDIGQCLYLLNMAEHVDAFAEKMVDGALLMDLDAEVFKTDFAISGIDAKKLLKFVKGWRPKQAGDIDSLVITPE